ncbi:MAG TPA: KTSC domain-containing protein [Sphingomicrobium sp.]|nr:KTSC domain-containing protein [Sphingomicrobium sp.]
MRFQRVPSSVIRRFSYAPSRRELHVEFVTGRFYIYYGVPEHEAEAFRGAESKGRYFNSRIRDRYAFRELTAHS